MHFLVYMSGKDVPATRLADVGLPDLVDGALRLNVPQGPDGEKGTIFNWRTRQGAIDVSYQPERQRWIPSLLSDLHQQGAYWVGLWEGKPPTPIDLQRDYVVPSLSAKVELGDGLMWSLPKAAEVPMDLQRHAHGEWHQVPQQRYLEFCDAALKMTTLLRDKPQAGATILVSEVAEFLELALRINYRITPEVADHLRLWSSGSEGTVIKSALQVLMPVVAGLEAA